MGRYITIADLKGKHKNVERHLDPQIESYYIYYAEYKLDSLLGRCFTVPFSSNNITAKELAMDIAYADMGILSNKDNAEFTKSIMARIDDIKSGVSPMVTTSSDTTFASGGDEAWSTTMDYHPTFGMANYMHLDVSSQQLIDENDERA